MPVQRQDREAALRGAGEYGGCPGQDVAKLRAWIAGTFSPDEKHPALLKLEHEAALHAEAREAGK